MKFTLFNLKILMLVIFMLLSANVFADLDITVQYDARWGGAPTSNIKRLCENVALHFQEQLRDEHKLDGELTIVSLFLSNERVMSFLLERCVNVEKMCH